MKNSITLAVLAVLLVAGCTGSQIIFPQQPTVLGGTGLTIKEFSIDPTEVYGNATARIVMEVENTGGASVKEDEGMVMLIGSALDLTKFKSDTHWSSGTSTAEKVYKHFDKEMKPADPVRETPATSTRFTWNVRAPNIDTGQTRNDIFIGRVYYDYDTKLSGTIWVYSQSEADAARAAKRSLNPATFSSTSGPLAVSVKVSPDPVVLSSVDESFTLTIKLSSIGGGTLYKKDGVNYEEGLENVEITENELNRVEVDVSAPGMDTSACNSDEEELVSGKDATITCEVKVSSLPATFQGYPVTISASYGYFTERTASVSVSGR